MSGDNDVQSLEIAFAAIDELAAFANTPFPAGRNEMCKVYYSSWKEKIDAALLILENPYIVIIIKNIPPVVALLTVVKALKSVIEQTCELSLGVEPAKTE